jgi:phospholipid/cholesterol/gamma-HCH transport system substrate-binding protein
MKAGSSFGDLVVGLFVAGVFVLLAFFTIVISGANMFSGGKQRLDVYFSDVGSLRPHDSVIVRGVAVGQVKKMWLDEGDVHVELALKQTIRIRNGYKVSVQSSSLLGGSYLLVDTGSGVTLPEDARLIGEPPKDLMRDVAEVVAGLKRTLGDDNDNGMLSNLRKASASLADVLGRVERGEGTIGRLLSHDETIYTNLAVTAENLKTATDRIAKGQGSLGKLIADDGHVYDDIRAVSSNLRSISDRVERGEGTLGKLLSNDNQVYSNLVATTDNLKAISDRLEKGEGTLGKLLSKDDELYRQALATITDIHSMMDRIEHGEGTLGKLSKDDDLYRDVKGLVGDARQTLDGLRETTPVSTFSSIVIGSF